jgi:hypothetical protein
MSEPLDLLTQLLSNVIVPNLKAVHASQNEQIAANDRLERDIEGLRLHLDSQFSHLAAQLTACRAELAALQASLKAGRDARQESNGTTLIH